MTKYDLRGGESQTTIPASRWNRNRIHQAGLAGLFGGLLWAVWPFGAEIALADFYQTRAMDSVAIAYSLLAVVALGLMIVGVLGLYYLHVGTFGRLGTSGAFISGGALAVMAIGFVLDFVWYGTDISAIGHLGVLLGFVALLLGSFVLGIAVFRADHMQHARWLGILLSIAIPAGVALVIAKETFAPSARESDLWFWVAIMTAYGLSWILLGYQMRLSARSMAPSDTATM